MRRRERGRCGICLRYDLNEMDPVYIMRGDLNIKLLVATVFTISVWYFVKVFRASTHIMQPNTDKPYTDKPHTDKPYTANKQEYIPTILVGVMITDQTPQSRLEAFRTSFLQATHKVKIKYFFVKGKGPSHLDTPDVMRLDIHENIDEGKTFHWFRTASQWLQTNAKYHPLNGIVKMDTDTAVNWTKFSVDVFSQVERPYYIGRTNGNAICGGASYCPPTGCSDFTNECWIYMSGGWYALSLETVATLTTNCSYSMQNINGYEDLVVGQWIKNCIDMINIKSTDNGMFFCHSSANDDTAIESSVFYQQKCTK